MVTFSVEDKGEAIHITGGNDILATGDMDCFAGAHRFSQASAILSGRHTCHR
jgi:hypothetical protein